MLFILDLSYLSTIFSLLKNSWTNLAKIGVVFTLNWNTRILLTNILICFSLSFFNLFVLTSDGMDCIDQHCCYGYMGLGGHGVSRVGGRGDCLINQKTGEKIQCKGYRSIKPLHPFLPYKSPLQSNIRKVKLVRKIPFLSNQIWNTKTLKNIYVATVGVIKKNPIQILRLKETIMIIVATDGDKAVCISFHKDEVDR